MVSKIIRLLMRNILRVKLFLNKLIYNALNPEIGVVFMLHRVVEKQSILQDNRLLEITPEFLIQTIEKYKSKGYRFVTMDEIYSQIQSRKRKWKKFVSFTFDDGYADNYNQAYPIFKKYNCPFTIYIATDFPDYKAHLWWYVLEDLLNNNEKITLGDKSEYDCSTIEKKNQTFRIIREKIFKSQSENMSVMLSDLFAGYSFSFDKIVKENALSWEQIKLLSEDSLCTIGSHSISHGFLSNMSQQQLEFELSKSKSILEQKLNKRTDHFSYPYGNYNNEVVNKLSTSGYKTSVLAWGGKVRLDESCLRIKRISLN